MTRRRKKFLVWRCHPGQRNGVSSGRSSTLARKKLVTESRKPFLNIHRRPLPGKDRQIVRLVRCRSIRTSSLRVVSILNHACSLLPRGHGRPTDHTDDLIQDLVRFCCRNESRTNEDLSWASPRLGRLWHRTVVARSTSSASQAAQTMYRNVATDTTLSVLSSGPTQVKAVIFKEIAFPIPTPFSVSLVFDSCAPCSP